MVITKKLSLIFLLLSGCTIELFTCSFLRRYGVNSYITNIPLFFKKQDPDEPQRANPTSYIKNHVFVEEEIKELDTSMQEEPILQENAYQQSFVQEDESKEPEVVVNTSTPEIKAEIVALDKQEVVTPNTEDTEKNEGITPAVRRPRHIFHKK